MKKKQLFLMIVLVVCSTIIHAQSYYDEYSTVKKNAISINFAGTSPIMGITYERVLSNKISAEVGVGLISVGLGLKFFPFEIEERKLMLHLGISAIYFEDPSIGFYDVESNMGEGYSSDSFIIYSPIGISYFGRWLNFGLDIGPSLFDQEFEVYLGARIGVRF